ncbi:MAG TPA: hypothetical protein VGR69_08535 [Candidatus Rubrimentiphilum sp.]|nr:hypothetical protein [Candidatus Rubrimentiphilum sp.]
MKRSLFALCAISLCLSTAGVAYGASKKMAPKSSTPTAKQAVAMWAGTWNCVSGKSHFSTFFTPVLDGGAMQVSSTGANPNSGIATFDSRQNKWFYSAITATGGYFTMMGTVGKSTISFSQVAGNGTGLTLVVHRFAAKKYTETFGGAFFGKKMTSSSTCTK